MSISVIVGIGQADQKVDDGNLASDGHWNYAWDAENRLTRVWPKSGMGPQQSLAFDYDWQGRRVHKRVWSSANFTGTPAELIFVYDGWNLVAVLNTALSPVNLFLWGLDLSRTLQGAGGVGGLLEVTCKGSSTTNAFVSYDGNGNAMALVDAASASATLDAQYGYGPFGELLRATGPMAKANPFRFSTKFQDDETDIVMYPARPYSASTGRWLTRDPIEEDGGLNLCGFVGNDPVDKIDPLGFWASRLGGHDHQDMTGTAFDLAVRNMPTKVDSKCLQRVRKYLQDANQDQDIGANLDNNILHYNRDYVANETDAQRQQNRQAARTQYTLYITDASVRFTGDVVEMNCVGALNVLGHLSHSWQDYFAHGIHPTRGWRNSPNPFPGDPDNPGEYWPSTYKGLSLGHGPAEHPGNGEPPWGSPEEGIRRAAAQQYTNRRFQEYIPLWFEHCACSCSSVPDKFK